MAIWQENVTNQPAVWQPGSLDEAIALKQAYGSDACYVAGGTLLRTQWEGGVLPRAGHLISLAAVPELRGVSLQSDGSLRIGALTPLAACIRNELVGEYAPLLREAARQIAAPAIRNLATLGGNINFGVGDSIPALLVSDAQLVWLTEAGLRTQSLSLWLEEVRQGTRSTVNLLTQIVIPASKVQAEDAGQEVRQVMFYKKLGRREAFTPSLVTVAVYGMLDNNGSWISLAMAAAGGTAVAMRLAKSELWLQEQKYHAQLLPQLAEVVTEEVVTISDPFANADYRKLAAGNLIASGCYEALECN